MLETWNAEPEQAFMGALILEPYRIDEVNISCKDLRDYRNRYIYDAIKQVVNDFRSDADMLLIKNELEKRGQLDEVGGFAYLAKLTNETPMSLHIDAYAKEVRRIAELVDFYHIGQDLIDAATSGKVEVTTFSERLVGALRVTGGADPINEAVREYRGYKAERAINPQEVWGIETPWSDFNKATGGVHFGRSVLIYGDTGVGKTVMVQQIALHAARKNWRVRIYELEMSKRDLIGRFVSMITEIPDWKVHAGGLSDYEDTRIERALDEVEKLPISISDETHWTSSEIRADLVKNRGVDLVVVDYLALLQDEAETEYQKVEKAAKNLRQTAKDLDVALITVASEIKDGTVKGTKEVQFAQDEIWQLKKEENAFSAGNFLELIPRKLRHGGLRGNVSLQMKDKLPIIISTDVKI